MLKTIDKIISLEYNELITIRVIETDSDLTSILNSDLSFNQLYLLSKNNRLSSSTKATIRELFDYVILTKKDLVEKYNNLLSEEQPLIKEKPIKSIKPPRRYGLKKIKEDTIKQNGVLTNQQLTLVSVNNLKNLYVKIQNRLIRDMFTDKEKLSDEDYRTIRATITLIEKKINPIIKKNGNNK